MNRFSRQNIWHFLFRQNDFGTLLFFLLVSFLLWISMHGRHQQTLHQTVVRYRLDDSLLLPADLSDTLRVRLRGNGWEPWWWRGKWKQITVNLHSAEAVDTARLLHDIQKQWQDKMTFTGGRLNVPRRWHWKKVPVRPELRIRTAPHYALRRIDLHPDSVWVLAPRQVPLPDSLRTGAVMMNDLHGSRQQAVAVKIPPGMRVFPEKITVKATASLYEEKEVEVPVSIPPDIKPAPVLMPSRVHVHYKRWVGAAGPQKKWIFEPEKKDLGKREKLRIRLRQKPPDVFEYDFYPRETDYLIVEP